MTFCPDLISWKLPPTRSFLVFEPPLFPTTALGTVVVVVIALVVVVVVFVAVVDDSIVIIAVADLSGSTLAVNSAAGLVDVSGLRGGLVVAGVSGDARLVVTLSAARPTSRS